MKNSIVFAAVTVLLENMLQPDCYLKCLIVLLEYNDDTQLVVIIANTTWDFIISVGGDGYHLCQCYNNYKKYTT